MNEISISGGAFVIIGLFILLLNLVVLTLCLKLYTEYFKDKSQSNRAGKE